MKRIAKFEKVSIEQFKDKESYENIKLPRRATRGSAGYDFYLPLAITLNPDENIKIPTGIRCKMKPGWVLKIYPRSGLGFKYQAALANTVGIVDEDYYYSDNEGHIFIKLVNRGNAVIHLNAGDAFAQGIFVEFGITEDDDSDGIRNGGFGSTSERSE